MLKKGLAVQLAAEDCSADSRQLATGNIPIFIYVYICSVRRASLACVFVCASNLAVVVWSCAFYAVCVVYFWDGCLFHVFAVVLAQAVAFASRFPVSSLETATKGG